jgi:hypothetical protein
MEFNRRITWSIGLNRNGTPYLPSEAIEAVTRQLAARGIDGFTVTPGVGYWRGETEECLTVTVLTVWGGAWSRTVAGSIAHDLARDLGQEAVAWAVDALNGGGLAFS